MKPHSQDSLVARRRRRRQAHLRRRAVASAVLATVLTLGIVAITSGSGGEPAPAPALAIFKRPRIFPRTERTARIPYVARAGKREREIALTFDDGPGPYTAEVVRTLKRLHAPGTFFQVGGTEHYFTDAEEVTRREPLVTVGVHTLNHRRLDRLSRADQAKEIDGDTAILTAAGNPRPTLFRPPYGAYDATTLDLLRERGMTMVLWSVDSKDYERPGVDAIVNRVLTDATPGAIVLLHDAGGDRSQTIEALPRIVLGLRRHHYTLVSVPQLLKDAPPPRTQPKLGVGAG
ncbi:polysaccharide deacetylase family protein [Solirubrobacter soli]|uniref:polysaccharide deacetylase family protein n=1 Tax=Solirubrobacter soli TaxID=363832 RepID=UPI0012F7F532|nr:polysaccharide deacetylase family protein [Solirubrobacter soli]